MLYLLAACGEHDQALVSASASLPAPLDVSMLTVAVRDGDRSWQWRGLDFQPSADWAQPHTPERATRLRGTQQPQRCSKCGTRRVWEREPSRSTSWCSRRA